MISPFSTVVAKVGSISAIALKSDLVPQETTGGLDSVAVRFPSDRIAQELIKAAGGYVAAPSANTSGRPSPTTAQHVEEDLGEAIEMIIDGGQVGIGLESTIVDFTEAIALGFTGKGEYYMSDYFVRNASFLRCDNVILYMLPVLRNLLCFHLHFGI